MNVLVSLNGMGVLRRIIMAKERLEDVQVSVKVRTDKHTYQQSFMIMADAKYWLEQLFKKIDDLPYDRNLFK